MTDISTGVGFSLSRSGAVVEDTRWIWMEQELIPDVASKKELADLIDDLFGSDPCIDAPRDEEIEIPEEEEFEQAVQVHFDMDMCHQDGMSNYQAKLRVYRSHFNVPYTLRLTNGKVNYTKVKSEVVEGSIVVEEQAGVLLEYPIKRNVSDISISWNTIPIGRDGVREALPITRTGNALNWGKDVTGTIYYKYTTEYDEVDVTVYGSEDGTAVGECLAIAFYDGVYYALQLQPPDDTTAELLEMKEKYCDPDIRVIIDPNPDDVTCYIDVYEKWLCNCSGEESYHKEYERDVQCPEGRRCTGPGVHKCRSRLYSKTETGGYVSCRGDEDDVHDREFYKEKCCTYPPYWMGLPRCREAKSLIKATSVGRLSAEFKQGYAERWGNRVKYIAVWPEDGMCGEHLIVQDVDPINCCDGVQTLEYDEENSADVITSDGIVYVTGGRPPFLWKAGGELTFSGGQTEVITTSRAMRVYLPGDACGTHFLYIEDSCAQSVNGAVRGNTGEWVVTEDTIKDIYLSSCVKNGVRYTDDWCWDTGYGCGPPCDDKTTNYCNDPDGAGGPGMACWVEGNLIEEWRCE